MFCRKCGKQIPDDSGFCQYCGIAVESPNNGVSNNVGTSEDLPRSKEADNTHHTAPSKPHIEEPVDEDMYEEPDTQQPVRVQPIKSQMNDLVEKIKKLQFVYYLMMLGFGIYFEYKYHTSVACYKYILQSPTFFVSYTKRNGYFGIVDLVMPLVGLILILHGANRARKINSVTVGYIKNPVQYIDTLRFIIKGYFPIFFVWGILSIAIMDFWVLCLELPLCLQYDMIKENEQTIDDFMEQKEG